jgi:hypothetical protein
MLAAAAAPGARPAVATLLAALLPARLAALRSTLLAALLLSLFLPTRLLLALLAAAFPALLALTGLFAGRRFGAYGCNSFVTLTRGRFRLLALAARGIARAAQAARSAHAAFGRLALRTLGGIAAGRVLLLRRIR